MSPFRLLLLPFVPALLLIPAKPIERPRAEPETPVHALSLEVQALRTLYLLRATPEQIKAMRKFAKETAMAEREREKPHVSDDYRRVLANLRDALVADEDDDKIEGLEERLTELTEAEVPELDDGYRVTPAARRCAREVLRQLRPNQLAGYLGAMAEEIGDPQERLLAALEQVREGKDEAWKELRDVLADDLGWLLGGLAEERAKAIKAEVVALLSNVRELTDEEFDKQRDELEKVARRIGAGVSSTDVLRHALERTAARLLSNPRLGDVLDARLRADNGVEK